jgi:hypothetical protein
MIPFKVGDTVEYDIYGTLRTAKVTAIVTNDRNNRGDMFDGISNGMEVWGYVSQVKRVLV